MDDYVTLALVAASFFFVALSIALLRKFRQVSQTMNESSDLGKNMLQSLDQRLKKQDERIIDLMAKFEVIQARVLSPPPAPLAFPLPAGPTGPRAQNEIPTAVTPDVGLSEGEPRDVIGVAESRPPVAPSVAAEITSQGSQLKLDETQVAAMNLLRESPKSTRELTDALKKSREHTARIMKTLFDSGLVSRDDSTKPFVYQLTDEGRRLL